MTNEFYFTSYDGKNRIFAKEWLPPEEPCGIVMIAHGLLEHIERYGHFAKFLASYGLLVTGADQPGHGKTVTVPEERGAIGEDGWQVLVENLHLLRLLEQNAHPGLPVFLLGYSMGSFLARSYLTAHGDGLAGVLLCGTGDVSVTALRTASSMAYITEKKHGAEHRSERWQERLFAALNKQFSPARTKMDWLTRDEAAVDALLQDEMCNFTFTMSAWRTILNGILSAQNRHSLAKILPSLPVFLLSGAKDSVGENGRGVLRVAHAFQDAGVRDVTVKLYTDCRHDLLHELSVHQIQADILTWIENQL